MSAHVSQHSTGAQLTVHSKLEDKRNLLDTTKAIGTRSRGSVGVVLYGVCATKLSYDSNPAPPID